MYGVISTLDAGKYSHEATCPMCGVRVCRAYNSRAAYAALVDHNAREHS